MNSKGGVLCVFGGKMIGTAMAVSIWPRLRPFATATLQQMPGAGAADLVKHARYY
jgi:hypothetical protein